VAKAPRGTRPGLPAPPACNATAACRIESVECGSVVAVFEKYDRHSVKYENWNHMQLSFLATALTFHRLVLASA
jgi:hypothetical protein